MVPALGTAFCSCAVKRIAEVPELDVLVYSDVWTAARVEFPAGQREAVDKDVLVAAAKYAKYAIAAYGEFGLKFKDECG